jgi:lipopolysaccharide heptosyltransferase II
MKILVRLPNWLGDMVMSIGFLHELYRQYPGAEISVIAKKGIHELLPFFPPIKYEFIFDKEEHKGLGGLVRFGNAIRAKENFDLFFCLPNSFSSALMGYATSAKKRIGYQKELRSWLLTDYFKQPKRIHRVEEYITLLEFYTGQKAGAPNVQLHHAFKKKEHVVVNINSEASSRRLTINKAIEEINVLRKQTDQQIFLIGAPKEKVFVDEVFNGLQTQNNIQNLAGETNFLSLIELLASAQVMLTTDSGPAHLANALGTHTVVLFGAGKESNTAPYNKDARTIVRLNKLSCEPCQKNVCVKYKIPQCLQQLDAEMIVSKVKEQLS